MNICFNIPHAFHPGSSALDNACALRALLDCMINMNTLFRKHHECLPLYKSGVIYGRTHIWEPVSALYLPNKQPIDPVFWQPVGLSGGAKRGDCKSLASALIAEYRQKGLMANPVFRWAPRNDGSGALDFHILVNTVNGWEDPSRKLGMGEIEVARFFK
jgi:hypothetical protein